MHLIIIIIITTIHYHTHHMHLTLRTFIIIYESLHVTFMFQLLLYFFPFLLLMTL